MSKSFAPLILILLSTSVIAEIILIEPIHANPTSIQLPEVPTPMYIKQDGTIEGDEGAIQQSGNVYTLVRDISKLIVIQKNNITLDGNGFKITKPPNVNKTDVASPTGWIPSVSISGSDNIVIKNITFDNCYTAITIRKASNIVIIQNTIRNGANGIEISSCTNCSIICNEIVDHAGSALRIVTSSSYLNIAYNVISRSRSHGGWIAMSYSKMYRNNITDNSGKGLYLYGPNNHNHIFENNFINNSDGLFYQRTQSKCSNNTVYNNYWDNYDNAIVNIGADYKSGVDQSPLDKPISIEYTPSEFMISTTNIPEFPSWIILPLLFVGAFFASVYHRKLTNH